MESRSTGPTLRSSLFPVIPRHGPHCGHRKRPSALGECRLAHARAFDRRIADRGNFHGAGVPGFSIIAEDGNVSPGVPKVQSDIFMAAGKTNDVMINVPTSPTAPALAVFDRELSLSGNAMNRDAGMLAYISINGAGSSVSSIARSAGQSGYLQLVDRRSDVHRIGSIKGVIANDINVFGVQLPKAATSGTVTLNANGTFTYVPNTGSTAVTTHSRTAGTVQLLIRQGFARR